jgi:endogenous inhibitor of DNA gyrase (YacG/DUF329 family)
MARGVSSKTAHICERCGREYEPTNPRQKWCKACLTVPCAECGKPVYVGKRTALKDRNFCGQECMHLWQSKNWAGKDSPRYKTGYKVRQIEVACAQCGQAVMITGQMAKQADHHFCNNECRGKWYATMFSGATGPKYQAEAHVTNECEWCGKPFEVWRTVKDKRKFCSLQCRHHWQRVRMTGPGSPNWKGGGLRDERRRFMGTTGYRNWRHAVFARDNYTCQCCGDKRGHNLEAHHIWSATTWPGMVLDPANGVTFCEKCHSRLHVIDGR